MAKNDKRLDQPNLTTLINFYISTLFGEIGGSFIEFEVIDVNLVK